MHHSHHGTNGVQWQEAVALLIPTNPLYPFSQACVQFPFHYIVLNLLTFFSLLCCKCLRTGVVLPPSVQQKGLGQSKHSGMVTGIPALLPLPWGYCGFCGCQAAPRQALTCDKAANPLLGTLYLNRRSSKSPGLFQPGN